MLRTKRSFGSLKRGMKKLKKALVYQEMITDFFLPLTPFDIIHCQNNYNTDEANFFNTTRDYYIVQKDCGKVVECS